MITDRRPSSCFPRYTAVLSQTSLFASICTMGPESWVLSNFMDSFTQSSTLVLLMLTLSPDIASGSFALDSHSLASHLSVGWEICFWEISNERLFFIPRGIRVAVCHISCNNSFLSRHHMRPRRPPTGAQSLTVHTGSPCLAGKLISDVN